MTLYQVQDRLIKSGLMENKTFMDLSRYYESSHLDPRILEPLNPFF
jgi:hypothetical protein